MMGGGVLGKAGKEGVACQGLSDSVLGHSYSACLSSCRASSCALQDAGSAAQFKKVDLEYVAACARAAKVTVV